MEWKYNDGGRSKYFSAKRVNDCVVRSIAIATNKDYKEVYQTIKKFRNAPTRTYNRTSDQTPYLHN